MGVVAAVSVVDAVAVCVVDAVAVGVGCIVAVGVDCNAAVVEHVVVGCIVAVVEHEEGRSEVESSRLDRTVHVVGMIWLFFMFSVFVWLFFCKSVR